MHREKKEAKDVRVVVIRITEAIITDLLETKHSQDVFVPQCKDGATHYRVDPRHVLDVWTMARSWANPYCYGYEIKISRADFLGDAKWQGYLNLCNFFSFVCPPKVIGVEELPDYVGLYWTSTTGTRLYTKRAPAFRDVVIPESLFRYVLMARTRVRNEYQSVDEAEKWRLWLAEKDEEKKIGWNVSCKIRQLVEKRIDKVESENKRLRRVHSGYDEVRKICEGLNIDPSFLYNLRRQVEGAVKDAGEGALVRRLECVANDIGSLVKLLRKAGRSEDCEC